VVLRLEELTKEFRTGPLGRGRHRALDGVSLEIAKGEVFGLLGPNGAGKTTTLKLINNLLWPTSGRITIFDRPVGDPEARRRVGFLPEHPSFYDHLTAVELLTYLAGLSGLVGTEVGPRVARMLDRVGLGEARHRPVRQYSKGMVQRLGLAQALIHEPPLVLLDEPMSGLDPVGRREVRELILELRDEGRAVLFSSHILSDAELLCGRVAILGRGRVLAAGSTTELTSGHARGWDIAASALTPGAAATLQAQAVRTIRVTHGRYTFTLAAEARPEAFVAAVAAQGGLLEAVTPLRATLEDVFLERIS
jgi:ABC-2 type transport system ATP-binding protein